MSLSRKLIFIVGNSRSGTTMLGRILGNNSEIHTFGELHFFEHQVDANDTLNRPIMSDESRLKLLERLLTSARDGFFSGIQHGKYRREALKIDSVSKSNSAIDVYEEFLHYETVMNSKSIPCEQTPRYLFFSQEILDVFPNAVIINMVRDPRDVLLSQKNKWRRRFLGAENIPLWEAVRSWVNYHPWLISRLWLSAIRVASELESHDRFLSIKFEELVQMPEATIKRLCEFLGVEFEYQMIEVPQVGSSNGSDRPDKKGIDLSRTQVWKKGGLSNVELYICQQVSGVEMRNWGYKLVQLPVSEVRYFGSILMLFFKGSMALLMNVGRTKNLYETLQRRLNK